jgi:hypothetical protein
VDYFAIKNWDKFQAGDEAFKVRYASGVLRDTAKGGSIGCEAGA